VSSTISSLPASRHATGPLFDSFGGFTPLTRALLLPQFAQSLGKDFSLHRTSRRRPTLDANEAWSNVHGGLVQLRSQRGNFFNDLTLGSTFDAIGHRQPNRLAGETPLRPPSPRSWCSGL
jgi:hypothetical protein